MGMGRAHGDTAAAPHPVADGWRQLPTETYKGKQDAVDFVGPDVGWYGNGKGKLYRTLDGGASWRKVFDQPGTYIRALGFLDADTGYLGNIGTDYFPGVTDTTPLYVTHDGGEHWQPVQGIDGPAVKGICAIDVLRAPFINAGTLSYRVTIRAGGRVGGPAFLVTSRDGGQSWHSEDISPFTAMILDVKFLDERTGFIAGATDAAVETSHALVLKTSDGGQSWRRVYESRRPWELTWKLSFPTKKTGYVTVQNYDPAAPAGHVVAKTTDGGEHWSELPLAKEAGLQEFGVGFVDENHGWVGTSSDGRATDDGGKTWRKVAMGRYANKLKVVGSGTAARVYAIGEQLYLHEAISPR